MGRTVEVGETALGRHGLYIVVDKVWRNPSNKDNTVVIRYTDGLTNEVPLAYYNEYYTPVDLDTCPMSIHEDRQRIIRRLRNGTQDTPTPVLEDL